MDFESNLKLALSSDRTIIKHFLIRQAGQDLALGASLYSQMQRVARAAGRAGWVLLVCSIPMMLILVRFVVLAFAIVAIRKSGRQQVEVAEGCRLWQAAVAGR
jgi:uncharacterized membrane protein YesL